MLLMGSASGIRIVDFEALVEEVPSNTTSIYIQYVDSAQEARDRGPTRLCLPTADPRLCMRGKNMLNVRFLVPRWCTRSP